uniref:Uncharacterized protein n=1 Tax=Triticum urartu TaxID=4572 RepID=A0A8R7K4J9_TRIUA
MKKEYEYCLVPHRTNEGRETNHNPLVHGLGAGRASLHRYGLSLVHDLRHRREGHVAMSSSVTAIAYEKNGVYAWQTDPWLASHYCRLRFPSCLGLLLVCAASAAPAGRLLGSVFLPLLKFPLPRQGVVVLLARHTLHRGQHLAMHGHSCQSWVPV